MTYWRKKANVSLEYVVECDEYDALPLTKWGVAASRPAVSCSSASPVWNAVRYVSQGGKQHAEGGS
jgi:hypothetical protein